MGIRLLEVHYSLDHQERIYSTHYDQYGPDSILLSNRNHFLVLWKDIPKVDKKFKGPLDVSGVRRGVVDLRKGQGAMEAKLRVGT